MNTEIMVNETFEIANLEKIVEDLALRDEYKKIKTLTSFDFQKMIAFIKQRVEEYKNSVYDGTPEEQYAAQKKDRAMINKAIDVLKSKNIALKKEFLANYDAVDSNIKLMLSEMDSAQQELDRQAKEYERKLKEDKEKAIKEFYNSINDEIEESFRETLYTKVFDPKWLNVSITLKKTQDELTEKVLKYVGDCNLIQKMHSDFEEQGLKVLRETLKLEQALNLMETKRQEKEAILEKEREKIERETRAKIAEEERIKECQAAKTASESVITFQTTASTPPVQHAERVVPSKTISAVPTMQTSTPHMVIEIQGGMILSIKSTCMADITIIDHDVDSSSEIASKLRLTADCDVTLQ